MHRKLHFQFCKWCYIISLSFLGVGSIIGPPSVQTHLLPHTYLLSATSETGAVVALVECRERPVLLPSSNLLFQPSSNCIFGSLQPGPLPLEFLYNRPQTLPWAAYQRGKPIWARPPETVEVQKWHGIHFGKECPLPSHILQLTHNCLHLTTHMCSTTSSMTSVQFRFTRTLCKIIVSMYISFYYTTHSSIQCWKHTMYFHTLLVDHHTEYGVASSAHM